MSVFMADATSCAGQSQEKENVWKFKSERPKNNATDDQSRSRRVTWKKSQGNTPNRAQDGELCRRSPKDVEGRPTKCKGAPAEVPGNRGKAACGMEEPVPAEAGGAWTAQGHVWKKTEEETPPGPQLIGPKDVVIKGMRPAWH